jgi:hypothetical protein
MEALLLLIALTAIVGVLVVPMMRRRKSLNNGVSGARRAVDPTAGYGLVPTGQLDIRLPGPDHELIEALDETVGSQEYQPLARLLALTGDEWELRWQRVQSVAGAAAMELARHREAGASAAGLSLTKGAAVRDGRWLREWRAAQPKDAGGAEVYAQFLVWEALAEADPDARRIILEEARNVCHDAVKLAPQDPTPYITELFVARHLGYRKADFEALWAALLRLAPHHMGAHLAALPYWSEKGHGSRAEAEAFARKAAAEAPGGTLLPALPLFSLYEHLPDVNLVRGLYESEDVRLAIEAAEYAVDQVGDEHPVRPHVLHLLVCFLVRAERYQEAMEAVQAVDGYVGAVPWADSASPAEEYAAYRALAVAGWEATGGAPAGTH